MWPATVGVREACAALGVSPSWGYDLVKRGVFPCKVLQLGGRTRVITASLIVLLEG
jgi:predicted DNA-binding transcriptional regulator AlpA